MALIRCINCDRPIEVGLEEPGTLIDCPYCSVKYQTGIRMADRATTLKLCEWKPKTGGETSMTGLERELAEKDREKRELKERRGRQDRELAEIDAIYDPLEQSLKMDEFYRRNPDRYAEDQGVRI